MNVRDTLGANLKTLMQYHADRGEAHLASQQALSKTARVGRGTVQRMEAGDVSIGIDIVEAVAAAFGLQAWQIMVPGLDPTNPPVISVTVEERELWARIQERMRYVQANKHDGASGADRLDVDSTSKRRSKAHK